MASITSNKGTYEPVARNSVTANKITPQWVMNTGGCQARGAIARPQNLGRENTLGYEGPVVSNCILNESNGNLDGPTNGQWPNCKIWASTALIFVSGRASMLHFFGIFTPSNPY
jgi:hypothetical protein